MSTTGFRGRPRAGWRFHSLSLLCGVAFGIVPLAVAPLAVAADGPTGIGFTLEGCNGSESLLPAAGPYVCPDADYTSGDLGKQWQELDLVPMRMVATASGSAPASQTYDVAITGAAYDKKGAPGFDVISTPVLNTALSSASCAAATVSATATIAPGVNNDAVSIYRVLSVTQAADTTCVYDWYQRLALGSHAFSGSSLHCDVASVTRDGSGNVTALAAMPGSKTVPVPVNTNVAAPSIAVSLSATQGSGNSWSVGKSAQPGSLSMADTCDPEGRSSSVDVTVSWTRTQNVDGQTSIVATLYASNAADRALNVDVTDRLFDAAHSLVGHNDTGSVSVPANTSHYLVGTSTYSVAAGSSASYSDDASATWTDPVVHDTLATGTASDSAAVETVTSTANQSAVVTDTTGISGAGLEYSVDSASLSGGSFGSYAPGTLTTGAVAWTSPQLDGDGSAVLHVTVVSNGATAVSGSLADTAALLGSSGFTTTAPLSVAVNTGARFALAIDASIPDVLQGNQSATFAYAVTDAHGNSTPASISFAAGQTSGSATLTGLAAGTYTVHQTSPSGWASQADKTDTAALPNCSGAVQFANSVVPASATVQKITVPAGHEAGWSFTLSGPGAPAGGETVVTTGTGAVAFATALQEGDYTITESSTRDGWIQSAASGCSFTVDYPADAGRVFACTITNTQGTVSLPVTGGAQHSTVEGVATPNTGADLPVGEAGGLLLGGGWLLGLGWRRTRRERGRRG